MFDIFKFEKQSHERLEEFRDILCAQKTSLMASCVFNEWKLYLRQLVEPSRWQAIWKISAARCKELMVDFPALTLVQVEAVDFESLCATVRTVAVQDEFNLPSVNTVPLQQLFPTLDQREKFIDVERTACALDQLRFFVANIWRPWDLEDDVGDWVGEHLESRLKLHEDISTGKLLPKTGKKIRALIREGRELQLQIDNLNDEEELSGNLEDSGTEGVEYLEARKQMIIAELAMLENPIQRSLIESQESNLLKQKRRKTDSSAPEVSFVWLRGPAKELMNSLDRSRKFIADDAPLHCVESAQDALDGSVPGDTVLLCAGQHVISSAGGLAAGGVLRGELRQDVTVVGSTNHTLFDFSPRSHKVSLSSLTLKLCGLQLGMVLKEGTMVLDDCDLVGGSSNYTQQGIVVLPGALLVANNCNFMGFGTAINVHKDGRLEMKGCTITTSYIGIQVEKGGWISLSNTRIASCSFSGLKVLTQPTEISDTSKKTESVENLERYPEFKIEAVSFEGNGKDVFLIEKRNRITSTSDLNDDEDPF